MNLLNDLNLAGIKRFVAEKRDEARNEALELYACAFSRGTFLCTADKYGDQCAPYPEAECPTWHGTLKEINELIALVRGGKYPEVARIYISGGFDGAESPFAYYQNEDYEPWASSWYELIWSKEGE